MNSKHSKSELSNKLNPYISIWIKPRETVQQIVDTNPKYKVKILAAIAGICFMLSSAIVNQNGNDYSWIEITVISLLLGPIVGVINLYLFSLFIYFSGKLLRGQATINQLKIVYAWSNFPLILLLFTYPIQLLLFKQELFIAATPIISSSIFLTIIYLGFILLWVILYIWALLICIIGLSQVQKISIIKSITNLFLLVLSVFILIAVYKYNA